MLKNVIFDCSNTLLRFSIVESIEAQTGDYDRALRICNTIFNNQEWGDFDNGKISEENIAAAVLPLLPEEDRVFGEYFLANYIKCFTIIEGIPEFVADLKAKGYRLFLLSDFPASFVQIEAQFADLFAQFDELVVSYRVGVSKRDHGLFPHLLCTYGLKPEECIFFDDIPNNIHCAETYGISGVVFTDVAAARAAMQM